MFAGVVLQRASQEGLREEEAWQPVDGGWAGGYPASNEAQALVQVHYPAGQGLKGGISLGRPQLRHLSEWARAWMNRFVCWLTALTAVKLCGAAAFALNE